MQRSLLYNEKEQSELLFRNGYSNGYNIRETYLVAKYMRHVLGYKDGKLKKQLIEFCSQDKSFNYVTESIHIKNVIKNSKNNFIVRTEVFITVEEISTVRKIKDFRAQKIYISLLAIAKKNKSNFVSIKNRTEIKRIAGLNITNIEMAGLFHVLYKNNMIYPTIKEGKGGHKLLFIDWHGKTKIEIINDKSFYSLGKTYESLCGGHLIYCEECGVEMIRKSPAHKLCEFHYREKEEKRKR